MMRCRWWVARALLLMVTATGAEAQRRANRAVAIRAEMAAVLLQSQRYAEAASEYRVLLASDPTNTTYRMGLARALAWGDRPREAEREVMALVALRRGAPSASLDSMLLSIRSQLKPSSEEAHGWLNEQPRSVQYRLMLARALARERRNDAALVHYDSLVLRHPTADRLLERAQVQLARGELTAAQRDAEQSVRTKPSLGALLLLGDLHLARGNLAGARAEFRQAQRMRYSAEVAAALARLAREERPAIGLLPYVYGDSPGWQSTTSTTGDNLGVQLTTLQARRGSPHPHGMDASVGAEVRWMMDRHQVNGARPAAVGANLGASKGGSQGRWAGRARARLGMHNASGSDLVPEASLAAVAWFDAWGAGLEVNTGPAYPSLMTLASFAPLVNGTQLTEKSATVSAAGPIGQVDAAVSRQVTALSDENLRTTLQALARVPIGRGIAITYAASALTFLYHSPLYWAPQRYTSHSVGPELSLRQRLGWNAQLRVLPGFANSSLFEEDPEAEDGTQSSAFQLTAGAAASYRTTTWEAGATASYGRGRADGYRRYDIGLFASFAP